MRNPPNIVIEVIHIHGPLKGEIQEFPDGHITIGRHTSCAIRFPADHVNISRKHAEIIREGNQFKIIDLSTNGTFINGKKVKEAFLKNGDVVELAENGPKFSFFAKYVEGQVEHDAVIIENSEPQIIPEKVVQVSADYNTPNLYRTDEVVPVQPAIEPAVDPPKIQNVTVPLVIQYGPTIRTFKQVPVTIGKNSKCDLVIDHPAILDQHAQVFFYLNHYWIKDLTGQHLIRLNNKPIDLQSPLNPNDEISLSTQGPSFCFLGEGRLAELAQPAIGESPITHDGKDNNAGINETPAESVSNNFWEKFKKGF